MQHAANSLSQDHVDPADASLVESRERAGSGEIAAPMCPNCGQRAPGIFCPGCGQKQDQLVPRLRDLVREVLEEFFSIDGKVPRTFFLLFRPGALTAEWLAGRRARYVHPFRVFLIAAATWLIVGQVRDDIRSQLLYVFVIFVTIPSLAVASWIAFALPDRRASLMPFVVFSIHVHAFLFLVQCISALVQAATAFLLEQPSAIMYVPFLASLAAVAVYYVMAARRTLSLRWPRAILGSLLAFVLHVAAGGFIYWVIFSSWL